MKESKAGKILLSAAFVLLGAGALFALSPAEQPTVSEEKAYTVTYVADGVTVGTDTYTTTNTTVTMPSVPQKEHYTGAWETVKLNGGDKTVNAVYTPIEYTVTYVADGVTVGMEAYTVEDTQATAPNVPTKAWYVGEWEDVALNGGDKTVNAVWTEGEYTVTYVADGVTVGTDTYTVSNQEVTAPSVPLKTKFSGEWEEVTLDGFDKTVNVIWTEYEYAITYVVVFENNASLSGADYLDDYWSGMRDETCNLPTGYNTSDEDVVVTCLRDYLQDFGMDRFWLPHGGSSGIECTYQGMYYDEELTLVAGNCSFIIEAGQTGDITIYLSMYYHGDWASDIFG